MSSESPYSDSDFKHHEVEPAKFRYRLIANFIDSSVAGILYLPVSLPFAILETAGMVEGYFVIFFGIFKFILQSGFAYLYYAWFYIHRGATPGKLLFGLRVVRNDNGMYISYGRAFLREMIAKFVCIVTLGIGFIIGVFRADKRGLHDFISNTRVIRIK